MLPTLVIVGRRNVGKSALFNRLIEENRAIVSDVAGTTRDRTEGVCLWRGKKIRVVDTGGLDVGEAEIIDREVKKQARFAIKEADLILFLADARVGSQPAERTLATELRRLVSPPARGGARGGGSTPILLVANKAETEKLRQAATDPTWKRLGFDIPFPISAITGAGVGDLLDTIFEKLRFGRSPIPDPRSTPDLRVTIIGKPNVGKSSLLNKLLGEERVIVSPIPHTTREPQDTLLNYSSPPKAGAPPAQNGFEKHILLVDTAGIRKKAKTKPGIEQIGIYKTLAAIERSEVVIFVLDATESLDVQDKHLAHMIEEKGVGVVIGLNKWDLLHGIESTEDKTISPLKVRGAGGVMNRTVKEGNFLMKQIHFGLPGLTFAPVVFISALTGHGAHKLIPMALKVQENRKRVIPEEELAALLPKLILRHKPVRGKGNTRHPVIRAIEQTGTEPPTFVVVIGPKQFLHETYLRFIENRLREFYDFEGTPLKIWVKQERS